MDFYSVLEDMAKTTTYAEVVRLQNNDGKMRKP